VGGDDIERGHDVGMPDPPRHACLVGQHRDELGFFRQMRMESLDGHHSPESSGPDETSEMDGGHPTGSNDVVKLVPIDPHRQRAFQGSHFP